MYTHFTWPHAACGRSGALQTPRLWLTLERSDGQNTVSERAGGWSLSGTFDDGACMSRIDVSTRKALSGVRYSILVVIYRKLHTYKGIATSWSFPFMLIGLI